MQIKCSNGLECPNIIAIRKLQTRLKMIEISFEQINNSRNDLLKQLAEQELLNEKLLDNLK